ncbi:MAG: homogentisate 1,2-dioxygenase, partial [Bacteroidia bacterium]
MPFYTRSGQIPAKRHVQFRKPNGELYSEELVSTEGFSSLYSLIYHCHPPTLVKNVEEPYDVSPKAAVEKNMKHRSFLTFKTAPETDYLKSRKVLLFNNDVHIGVAAPTQSMTDYFFKNSDADEVLFVHEGSGVLKTIYGQIPFDYGDYLVIPRGTIYQ